MAHTMIKLKVIPRRMKAVVTTGNGGFDKLQYSDVDVPAPGPDDALLEVLAAGVNNTEINTRLGWYSATVTAGTEHLAGAAPTAYAPAAGTTDTAPTTHAAATEAAGGVPDGGWNAATPFPLIQGTDCCGRVVAVGSEQYAGLLGARALVRPCMRTDSWDSLENRWMASDFDGSFAQFVRVPADEVFPVVCNWSDAELATIPCAYGTAENMIERAGVGAGSTVLVTGASGGVGSAAVQLAKRRGAEVVAITRSAKFAKLRALGADRLLDRDDPVIATLGEQTIDVVVDNVAGNTFGDLIKVLKRGGRYVTSGAIAGPLVRFDVRDMYLKDISFIGCTAWDRVVFPNLIRYIEQNQIRPLLARTFALGDIVAAQQFFLEKQHVGKIALVPPAVEY